MPISFSSLTFLILMCLTLGGIRAQVFIGHNVVVTEAPADNFLYQRDSTNHCHFTIKGYYKGTAPLLLVRQTRFRYAKDYKTVSSLPVNVNPDSTFELQVQILAEMREWTFALYAGNRRLIDFENVVCGDVFAVLGQSNGTSDLGGPEAVYEMNGDTFNSDYSDRYARAVGQGIWGLEANRYPYSWKGWGPAGSMFYDQYHAGGWPLKLQHDLIKEHGIPVGIINASFSGSSITSHFADSPPIDTSFGPGGDLIHDNPAGLNAFEYFLSKLARAGARNNLKYIFWYQGETDVSAVNCSSYYKGHLDRLKKDWEDSIPALEEIFLFQLNTSCTDGLNPQAFKIREAQRQFCNEEANVHLITTSGLHVDQMANNEVKAGSGFNQPCHYNRHGMEFLADRVYPLISRRVYNDNTIPDEFIYPNELSKAHYDDSLLMVTLEFNYPLSIDAADDMPGQALLKDYFFDQDYAPLPVENMTLSGNTITLQLSQKSRLKTISLLPATFYTQSKRTYYGPWILTAKSGMGIPFFADIPVEHSSYRETHFKTNWSCSGFDNEPHWLKSASEQVISGDFMPEDGEELLVISENGDIRILNFSNGTWVQLFSKPAGLVASNTKIQPIDVDGNGRDELLLGGAIYSFSETSGFQRWYTFPESPGGEGNTLLTGNFTGDAAEELVCVQPFLARTLIYKFSVANGSLTQTSEAYPIDLTYRQTFTCGDFNDNGYQELLAFGEGAGLHRFNGYYWEHLWTASSYNHFEGWEFPTNMNGRKLFTANFDSSYPGDELLIMDESRSKKGVSVFGYDPIHGAWNPSAATLATDAYLGEWPFHTFSETAIRYLLLETGSVTTSLLAIRDFDCGGTWMNQARLMDFDISLLQGSGPEIPPVKPNSFTLFPNPTSALLHIESQIQLGSPTRVRVINSDGRILSTHLESFLPNNFILDLQYLPSGFYFIELQSGTILENHKISLTH